MNRQMLRGYPSRVLHWVYLLPPVLPPSRLRLSSDCRVEGNSDMGVDVSVAKSIFRSPRCYRCSRHSGCPEKGGQLFHAAGAGEV